MALFASEQKRTGYVSCIPEVPLRCKVFQKSFHMTDMRTAQEDIAFAMHPIRLICPLPHHLTAFLRVADLFKRILAIEL